MIYLQHLVERWIDAEARQRPDADARASAALQALPPPRPGRDLVAAVMAALSPVSLWSRRPVRFLLAAAVVVVGVGILATLGSVPALTAIAGLSLWRELGSHLLVVGLDFGLDLLQVVRTTWKAIAAWPAVAGWGAAALGVATVMLLTGTLAMTRISMWRDEENWKHV